MLQPYIESATGLSDNDMSLKCYWLIIIFTEQL